MIRAATQRKWIHPTAYWLHACPTSLTLDFVKQGGEGDTRRHHRTRRQSALNSALIAVSRPLGQTIPSVVWWGWFASPQTKPLMTRVATRARASVHLVFEDC